jgi:predicted nucleotide-binding protein
VAYTGPQRDSAAVCSVPNTERLQQMLDDAGFALLVLTAESEGTDGVVLASQNVVHEAGLFQASVPAARQPSEGGCWRCATP